MNETPPARVRKTVALRAHMRRAKQTTEQRRTSGWDSADGTMSAANVVMPWSAGVLVFDTETTTDYTQRLTFGVARYCRWVAGLLLCVMEYVFYADELPTEDPEGYAALVASVGTTAAKHVRDDRRRGVVPVMLLSRRAFLDTVMWPALQAGTMIVGFNLPFDLSRLAVAVSEGRKKNRGAFSFTLFDYWDAKTGRYLPNQYRPRITIKRLDSKRSFIACTTARELPGRLGRFLDLRTLTSALTGESLSLAAACRRFGAREQKADVDGHGRITQQYIEYARQDVRATEALLERARVEFDALGISADPCRIYSSAGIARACYEDAGIRPPREKFTAIDDALIGRIMTAYYGGRAEVRIRNTAVPVVYCDFLSMYPTNNANLGLSRLLVAESLDTVDVTDEVRAMLADLTPERLFNREVWSSLCVFCEIVPDGDILPARTQYADYVEGLGIGLNYLWQAPGLPARSLWYALPDVLASVLLAGKVPNVVRALRLVPNGVQPGLRRIALGGRIAVDPASDDLFRRVIEERKRAAHAPDLSDQERERLSRFLKLLANAGSYGVFAQLNPDELPKKESERVTIYGVDGPFTAMTHRPEDPGPFYYPPFAALTTAGARLMLALLERAVIDRGGSYAFCDTDSMAIVSTEAGGLVPCEDGPWQLPDGTRAVRALSWSEVREIVASFARLNPYDQPAVPGSVLKIEAAENLGSDGAQRQIYCYGTSAKRYALFTRPAPGRIDVIKASEHGLGQYLNPGDSESPAREWIRETWHTIISRSLGYAMVDPAWIDRPAISRFGITSPELLAAFSSFNAGRRYRHQVKPFNFLLAAQTMAFGRPANASPTRHHMVAPFEPDARKWLRSRWTDRATGARYPVTTTITASADLVAIKAFRHVLTEYAYHPEAKSGDSTGVPCGPTSSGVLRRLHITLAGLQYIGKESNHHDEVESGILHNLTSALDCYFDVTSDWESRLGPFLRTLPVRVAADALALSTRSVRALRNGHSRPSKAVLERLASLAERVRPTTSEVATAAREGAVSAENPSQCARAAAAVAVAASAVA